MTTTQFSSESRGQYKAKAYAAASATDVILTETMPLLLLL
jgi:hypothetical protein